MDWSWHSFLVRMIVIGFFFSKEAAFAYPTPVDFNGRLSRWNIDPENPVVTFEVFAEDTIMRLAYVDVVKEAAGVWNSVHGSYVDLAPVAGAETAKITIHYDLAIAGGDSSAGYAEFDSTDEHGPKHCMIHIAAPTGIDWTALGKTTLHELGHCLGLGHSVVPESIMSYRLDVNGFSLALDDEAALSRLYPADGSTPKKPPGCTVGASRPNQFKILLALLLLPSLAGLLRKRFLKR